MKSDADFQALVCALDSIVQGSYEVSTAEEFRGLLDLVDRWAETTDARYLIDAVRSAIFLNRQAVLKSGNEFALQREFARKVRAFEILVGWRIESHQNAPRHVPDFWIARCREEFYPVEVKLKVFDAAALRQLQRYMEFYKCDKGFAVAPKLSCTLPDNVHFVEVNLPK